MKKFDLTLSFKGDRTYLHGTDMLHSLSALDFAAHTPLTSFKATFHRMTDRNLSLAFEQGAAGDVFGAKPGAVASVWFHAEGRPCYVAFLEEPGQPSGRYAYDEDSIVGRCFFDLGQRVAELHGAGQSTPIETLVAMNKALHLRVFPENKGKWLFVGWESPHWPLPSQLDEVSIEIKHVLGTKLTKAEVRLGKEILGWISFSARPV